MLLHFHLDSIQSHFHFGDSDTFLLPTNTRQRRSAGLAAQAFARFRSVFSGIAPSNSFPAYCSLAADFGFRNRAAFFRKRFRKKKAEGRFAVGGRIRLPAMPPFAALRQSSLFSTRSL
ncbi:hypothetical protein [Paenibacillus sp. GYB003]|uniref:hypothetical protein n=1 Tax=Paenibacillus sp. GYB003 TaxID=2994392 RepID=UPI002F968D85